MNLCKAANANDPTSLHLLLQNGANANHSVHWRTTLTRCPMVKDLGEHMLEDHQYDALPLHVAIMAGAEDAMKILIAAGADVNAKDGRGRSALFPFKHFWFLANLV
ncbi:hypothetical protein BC936DRAFT_142650 [Jimgerdemannia flammicorona]|uniref:Uncharacterized protein n=2 Tax=Jimgerdemannia flammicorona TaxID=994334 RepID=A0A433QJC0_9FUNG|nr:hypothetical protein BC936DRAFT_142650 [Jimgerdemannia flammicorona]RUS29869.1 hypothetical protein BC938DRAFT_480126 [Jimgerdemannia flammicorona]